jgi:hypothetical protein
MFIRSKKVKNVDDDIHTLGFKGFIGYKGNEYYKSYIS